MANRKRPSVPASDGKSPGPGGGLSFSPASVVNANDGGSHSSKDGADCAKEEKGTGPN